MKFPVKFCGTWLMLFSNNVKFDNMNSELSIDYENVVFTTKTHYPLFHVENQKKGFITKIDSDKNTARVIWNKNRKVSLSARTFLFLFRKHIVLFENHEYLWNKRFEV